LGWAALEAGGKIYEEQALLLGTTVNMSKLLGVQENLDGSENVLFWNRELVATVGGDSLEFGTKVVAVASSRRGFSNTSFCFLNGPYCITGPICSIYPRTPFL